MGFVAIYSIFVGMVIGWILAKMEAYSHMKRLVKFFNNISKLQGGM